MLYSGIGDGGTPAVSTSVIVAAKPVTGSHVLKVEGYSRTKGLGNGKYHRSGTFDIGGHLWCIKYYPDGEVPETADWICFYILCLDETDALDVQAQFKCSLLEVGQPMSFLEQVNNEVCNFTKGRRHWGFRVFVIKRTIFEKSKYLKDDCFSLRCDVTVSKKIRTEVVAMVKFVTVPPSDIHCHLGHLLYSEEAADVTFEVAGDTIKAHRLVLAVRSPVFKAELFGPMQERTMSHIRIHDMEARVFRAMIHFVYNDSLPEMDLDDTMVMTQHLLVAADKYGLERLKLVCEDILCSYIDAGTAATTLVLAEQHGCKGLKEACFKFLEKPSNFKAQLGTDGFDHLTSSCPSVLNELLAKVL